MNGAGFQLNWGLVLFQSQQGAVQDVNGNVGKGLFHLAVSLADDFNVIVIQSVQGDVDAHDAVTRLGDEGESILDVSKGCRASTDAPEDGNLDLRANDGSNLLVLVDGYSSHFLFLLWGLLDVSSLTRSTDSCQLMRPVPVPSTAAFCDKEEVKLSVAEAASKRRYYEVYSRKEVL